MRTGGAIGIAAIATMIALRSEPPAIALELPVAEPPSPPIRVTAREPARPTCAAPDDSELTGDEAVLARYWRVANPCGPLPVCVDPHPIVKLAADVDPSDGIERMIGSKRFGVAMLSSANELLAFYETSCMNRDDDDRLQLSARNFTGGPRPQLVIRERTSAHCGEFNDLTVVRRVGDELEEILSIDEGGRRGCNVWDGEWRARIHARPGAVDVTITGWSRTSTSATNWEYGPRSWFHHVCRMRLAADGRFDQIDGGRSIMQPPGDTRCD